MVWTVEKCKELLPDIRVRLNQPGTGREVNVVGCVRGRRLPFAHVHVGMATYEAAWDTVAHLLTNDRPLDCTDGSGRPVTEF